MCHFKTRERGNDLRRFGYVRDQSLGHVSGYELADDYDLGIDAATIPIVSA